MSLVRYRTAPLRVTIMLFLERIERIELSYERWQRSALPLSYIRIQKQRSYLANNSVSPAQTASYDNRKDPLQITYF